MSNEVSCEYDESLTPINPIHVEFHMKFSCRPEIDLDNKKTEAAFREFMEKVRTAVEGFEKQCVDAIEKEGDRP